MENRSITYLLLFGICSMLAIMQSCQKTDDLEADINSLKDRVAALEKATEGLNTSFASLQALMQKNKVIIGITPTKDGLGYLLELSDGTSIKVMESEAVQASVPEFSVDEEGYWIYKTSNNTNFKYMYTIPRSATVYITLLLKKKVSIIKTRTTYDKHLESWSMPYLPYINLEKLCLNRFIKNIPFLYIEVIHINIHMVTHNPIKAIKNV